MATKRKNNRSVGANEIMQKQSELIDRLNKAADNFLSSPNQPISVPQFKACVVDSYDSKLLTDKALAILSNFDGTTVNEAMNILEIVKVLLEQRTKGGFYAYDPQV